VLATVIQDRPSFGSPVLRLMFLIVVAPLGYGKSPAGFEPVKVTWRNHVFVGNDAIGGQ
jgi:hypothetical protein